jgi:hypothetical protein
MTHPGLYNLPPVQELHYKGMVDFMITNRWCFDYINFVGRMNGEVKPYPIEVPPVDWGWMIAAPVCAVLSFIVWNKFRKLSLPTPGAAATTTTTAAAPTA